MEEEKKEQEVQMETCPCCGKPTLEPEKTYISNEVIDHYLACILTGEPFAKDYYLYNGKMKVRVTSLPDETLDKMNLLTSKFNFIQEEDLKDAYHLFLSRLFTFLPIVSITIKTNGEEKIKDIQAVTKPLLDEAVQHTRDKEWLDKAYQTLLDPAVILCVPKNVLNDVVVGHLKVEKLLETQSASKNFFQGIVRA